MTVDRKRWLAKMIDRKVHAVLVGANRPAVISVYMSLADTHFTEEDLDFIIDRVYRLARGESVDG